jgi:hypothetical protein
MENVFGHSQGLKVAQNARNDAPEQTINYPEINDEDKM